MDYLILSIDKPGQEHIRDRLRPQRIAWLEANRKIIVAAGGIVDDRNRHVSGGLMIIKVSGREEAEKFAEADPFTHASLYESTKIVRWRRVFFNFERVTAHDPFKAD